MFKFMVVLGMVFTISGCAVVSSSPVERVGGGVYKAAANMKGVKINRQDNSELTRSRAIADAKAFCLTVGDRYPRVSKQSVEKSGRATAVVYFNCVK